MTGADPAAMNFLAAVVPEEKQGNQVASTYHLNGINTDGGTQASLHFYGKLNAKQYQKAIEESKDAAFPNPNDLLTDVYIKY